MLEIPLTNSSEQLFSIVINGDTYAMRVLWNTRSKIWSLTISDFTTNEIIVSGVTLLGGADRLRQYNLNIRNMFQITLEQGSDDPTFENLGTGSRLVVLTDDEVASVSTV